MLLRKRNGDGIEIGLRGHLGVERRLEGADHGRRRHQGLELPDGGQVGGIVGRGHGVEIGHGLQDILRQILNACDAFGVDDLKAHAGDFLQGFNAARQKMLQHGADGLPVGGENGFQLHAVAGTAVPMAEQALGPADPFRAARGQNLLAVGHVEQLIFQ